MREAPPPPSVQRLLLAGRRLEWVTLTWNAAGVVVLAAAAIAARSVALAGFGLDSVIEIGASTVVLWDLADGTAARGDRALRMIGRAFALLAIYLATQSTVVLLTGFRPHHSPVGMAWTACTAVVMFGLARGKATVGSRLGNPVLRAEGRVTLVDGVLASTVLLGLALNAFAGWWWADPVTGYVILGYAAREARSSFGH